jgi:pantoate--beta-alanine ligase
VRRVTTIAEVRAAVADARARGRRVALVPTMGALHEGHLANVRVAADIADTVVVSIFVNPTQFDRADDLAAYPRDLAADEAALAALGDAVPQLVFAPPEQEVYPRAPRTTVRVAQVSEPLEGTSRPGHFDGVATVVTKLFNIVQPDVAVFGRKDAQQNQVIRTLVADLDLPVELVLAPTIREHDGLALSSRNRRLAREERTAALALSRALAAAVREARRARDDGEPVSASRLRTAATGTLQDTPRVDVDYLEVVDPDTFTPPDASRGEAADGAGDVPAPERLLVAVAAVVGPVRLIDNVEVGDLDDEERLLAATGAS